MPEVMPCPAAMNDAELLKLKHRFDDVCQSSTTPELFELCRAGSHLVDAIRALPRALRWTHEPPKVAGEYYRRFYRGWIGGWDKPEIIKVDSSHISRSIRIVRGTQWSDRPIAPPVEG